MSVDAWREAVAAMAAKAIESVDAPMEEDEEHVICDPLCTGPADPRCVCEGNVARPGC